MRFFIRFCLFLSIVRGPLAFSQVKVGDPAPALRVTTVSNTEFNLQTLKGKTVVIHFWATWCPACRIEMPLLSRIYQQCRTRHEPLEMIAISLDRRHDRESAIHFMQGLEFSGGMLSDANSNGFGDPAELPITYVIDTQGFILSVFKASPDSEKLTERKLLDAIHEGEGALHRH